MRCFLVFICLEQNTYQETQKKKISYLCLDMRLVYIVFFTHVDRYGISAMWTLLRFWGSIQICVVAFLSTIWYLIGAWSGGSLHDFNPSLWTLEMFWEWMVVFPWIPALYTGIFSTVLCLWVEVCAKAPLRVWIIYSWIALFLGTSWDTMLICNKKMKICEL